MGNLDKVIQYRGTELHTKGWEQEAALRMLNNNLHPDVAENPEDLIVYGGIGKAARNWDCYYQIIESLKSLENDETLLIQSGKPVATFKTSKHSPRVLIANSNLVPAWATPKHFNELDKKGLMMYGQMTAGSWLYIGSQGIIQGTYETFAECANQHFGGSLKGTITVTAGLGGMGGSQPLGVTMNGGVVIAIEVDPTKIQKRLDTGYLDMTVNTLDEAISLAIEARNTNRALSIGLLGNAVENLSEMIRKNFIPDIVTDQTSAHDPLYGYLPLGMTLEEGEKLRIKAPDEYVRRSKSSMAEHVKLMLEMRKRDVVVFEYGNNIRQMAHDEGITEAFNFPGFVSQYVRPKFCEGNGPFRWIALSGDPEDIYKIDERVLLEFSEDKHLCKWIKLAQEKIKFQGLPSRICWLKFGERAKIGKIINEMVANNELKAPIVIGRDHMDSGSVASPNRETEGMKDGSDAVADWPILNALLNGVSGASWVSLHHGGGVGMGYSIHSGTVIVADGTADAGMRIERTLTNDPATGVVRHADAGYDIAIKTAKKNNIKMPMLNKEN